ncbi:cytoplasmic tRNA 2-thiolation protein 2 isoform X2 [Eublepharis macularius]|uniref:Cytoplasmic tRNA 2-thiolation protein 2 n=1 Tax=Eublepharis macularius TaxID=481883 RepID=A0AA97KJT3_EUBMA|nr:cytoplasmic tRNA 2-thiolation protein 2 isoform X2 [Eublepharis macularius]
MCESEEGGGCGGGGRPARAPRGGRPLKCMKCKEGPPVLIIRVGDAFCKACFKDYFVHKFRALLGKNRCIFPGEKVLLAFSGGPASSAMVRQVQEGLSREAAKKLRFKPGILFVDEGGVCGQGLEKRGEVRSQLERILRATGFPYHLVNLEEVFGLPGSILRAVSHSATDHSQSYKEAVDGFIQQQELLQCERTGGPGESLPGRLAELSIQDPSEKETAEVPGPLSISHTAELTRLFGAVKTLTAREELLQTLRNHLILHVARTSGYTKVMMGDSCTRVAVKLLTNLCLGRGAFLAGDTGFSDGRHGDVLVLRPMREYSAKEIAFYNRLFGVPAIFTPALATKAPDRASIHRLIESFLCKLQSDFPSTVSTVYRTGEKLGAAPGDDDSDGATEPERCLLCLCTLDTNVVDGSSLQSTLLSEELCQKPPLSAGSSCCEDAPTQTGCCKAPPVAGAIPPQVWLLPLLCYSCRLTIKDMSCLEPLPPYIHSEAERRRRRAAMKQEIQEFLLEDDEAPPAS